MNMNDPVDIDLAKHLNQLDKEDQMLEAAEELQKEMIEHFYMNDVYASVEEDFLTWFDEEGIAWEVVQLVDHYRQNRMQEWLDGFEDVCKRIDEKVIDMSWDNAVEGLKKTEEV